MLTCSRRCWYDNVLSPTSLFAKRLCTFSMLWMPHIKCGDHATQLYSRSGRIYVTKEARTNRAVSRLAKQHNITLARWWPLWAISLIGTYVQRETDSERYTWWHLARRRHRGSNRHRGCYLFTSGCATWFTAGGAIRIAHYDVIDNVITRKL